MTNFREAVIERTICCPECQCVIKLLEKEKKTGLGTRLLLGFGDKKDGKNK